MELITSGLESYPERLTPQAIYSLSILDDERIREMLFNVQIVAYKDMQAVSPTIDYNLSDELNILA
jgi:hypothetical protein